MDLETLTLLKLFVVAGLAWLSLRKIKQAQQHHQLPTYTLQEMPIIQHIKLKDQSSLSTSAVSKPELDY